MVSPTGVSWRDLDHVALNRDLDHVALNHSTDSKYKL